MKGAASHGSLFQQKYVRIIFFTVAGALLGVDWLGSFFHIVLMNSTITDVYPYIIIVVLLVNCVWFIMISNRVNKFRKDLDKARVKMSHPAAVVNGNNASSSSKISPDPSGKSDNGKGDSNAANAESRAKQSRNLSKMVHYIRLMAFMSLLNVINLLMFSLYHSTSLNGMFITSASTSIMLVLTGFVIVSSFRIDSSRVHRDEDEAEGEPLPGVTEKLHAGVNAGQ